MYNIIIIGLINRRPKGGLYSLLKHSLSIDMEQISLILAYTFTGAGLDRFAVILPDCDVDTRRTNMHIVQSLAPIFPGPPDKYICGNSSGL